MYKNAQKFNKRPYPSSKMMPIQVLCSSYSIIQLSVVVLQQSPLYYPLSILRKMQHRTAIWIIDAFCTSPTEDIEAITGLIPIHLYLKKLYNKFLLREFLLSLNHIIKSITTHNNSQILNFHQIPSISLTLKQALYLKSPFVDMYNKYNKFFPVFSLLDIEFSLGSYLHDSFPDQVSFHPRPQNIIQI